MYYHDFFFFYRFSEGLQTLGLLELVRSHPVAFRDVFSCSVTPLRAFDLVSLFVPELSTPGSNLWRTERRVEGFWRDFLLEVEGNMCSGKYANLLKDVFSLLSNELSFSQF